jgi:hypothetical protein
MDWSALVAACRRWRLSLSVAQTIRRAAALWGPVCPPDALGELESHPARWTDRWTLRQAPRDAASPLFHVLCNLCCTSGIRFRLAYVLALLRPGASHLAECYPWRHRGWTICAMVWRGVRGLGRFLAPSVRPIERRVRPSAPRRSPIHRARATLSAGAVQAGR